jgi:hypothetical protein
VLDNEEMNPQMTQIAQIADCDRAHVCSLAAAHNPAK